MESHQDQTNELNRHFERLEARERTLERLLEARERMLERLAMGGDEN